MIVWIHKTNLASYHSLMDPNARIIAERELDVQVQFDNAGMSTWVAVGYWYGFD